LKSTIAVQPVGLARMRTTWLVAALAVVAALVLALATHPASTHGLRLAGHTTAPGATLGTGLSTLAAEHPTRKIEVIAQFSPGTSAEARAAIIRRAGGRVTRDLHLINGLGARMTAHAAADIARQPAVRAVTLNAPVKPQALSPAQLRTAYVQSAGVDKLWPAKIGATGKGVGVAVIDTGVDGDLPDFRTSPSDATSRVIATAITNPDATSAADGYGHGTHVAGIIAGNGSVRPTGDALLGAYVGAAPDANIIAVKASDDTGAASVLDVINGVQFAVDHKDDYNIRVINLSLRATTAQSYLIDPLDAAVEEAWFHGIAVVAAAGNDGSSTGAVTYAPANDPYVITVGGVDDMGTKDLKDDQLPSWSSRGLTQDGLVKPEIMAPGAHIVATLAPGSRFAELCPQCVTDGEYFRVGGTSMAAGVVSGIVADLLGAHPGWTPDQVKGALMATDRPIKNVGVNEVAADKALVAKDGALVANVGLTPNSFIDAATGSIDPTRATWSRATWSTAVDGLRATWSRATWSCDCSTTTSTEVDPTRATWSRATWSASFAR
jgi:serine protease AprX